MHWSGLLVFTDDVVLLRYLCLLNAGKWNQILIYRFYWHCAQWKPHGGGGYGTSNPACLFTCVSLWVDAPRAPSLSRVLSTNVAPSGLSYFLGGSSPPFHSLVLTSLIGIRGCAGLCIHTTCKISRHGTDGFTSPPKEVCGFLSLLKIHHPWPVLNPRTFGPIANTVTTIPPR
jgi:hypothetical protein